LCYPGLRLFVYFQRMKRAFLFLILLTPVVLRAQQPFEDCRVTGSVTIYDHQHKKWFYTDSADAQRATLPASTFKVVNLLIALETGVIRDENDTIKWVGHTDTTLYGYRPDIYRDMTVREAFQVSAGWVFIELAKKIGKERYLRYLKACDYGNLDLSRQDADFWNFGRFGISPANQVGFLVKVYEEKLPFSKRNLGILKQVMITERRDTYTIRSKTGWTRPDGYDMGWWVGYVQRRENVYFFATRIWKKRSEPNKDFQKCRVSITKHFLRQSGAID
jgi:beta-lactamase class D